MYDWFAVHALANFIIAGENKVRGVESLHIPKEWTYEDIRVRVHTGRFVRDFSSQDKHAGKYRSGMLTKIGDIEEHEWFAYAEELIRRNGDEPLFKRLKSWYRENCAWLRGEKELHRYTLECFVAGIHNCPDWVDYEAFHALNRSTKEQEG
ncbi:MAG: hypothetical protein IKU94_02345 [Bacteroidaceae bacterium]|nr:hypothetical protein [Bacteroidaceae bacterium]